MGVVDYGVGNHASVRQCLHHLELRCRVSDDPAVLSQCHLLLLPGVGAFRPAMQAIESKGLGSYLVEKAAEGKPLLGICLGMQLLTEASSEDGAATGLGLIPGEVVALGPRLWHIGWNTVELLRPDPLFDHPPGDSFFFNHSYAYRGPESYQVARTVFGEAFGSIIRRGNIVGVQFHPEKSQAAGHALLRGIILGLCDA